MTEPRYFKGIIAAMRNIDRDDLIFFGVIEEHNIRAWQDYQEAPLRFVIKLNDEHLKRFWGLISERCPEPDQIEVSEEFYETALRAIHGAKPFVEAAEEIGRHHSQRDLAASSSAILADMEAAMNLAGIFSVPRPTKVKSND